MQLEVIDKLLHGLIAALVTNERAIEIECLPGVHRVRWTARVHLDDHGMLVGKRGAHVKALNYLVAMIGAKKEKRYDIWAHEPWPIDRAPIDRERPEPPSVYAPTHEAALLQEAANALCEGSPIVSIESRNIHPLDREFEYSPKIEIIFTIRPTTREDMETLKGEHGVRDEQASAELALAALWKAYGSRVGVKFTVNVV